MGSIVTVFPRVVTLSLLVSISSKTLPSAFLIIILPTAARTSSSNVITRLASLGTFVESSAGLKALVVLISSGASLSSPLSTTSTLSIAQDSFLLLTLPSQPLPSLNHSIVNVSALWVMLLKIGSKPIL